MLDRTWKMAYMMQVRGRLWEYSDTVKMFRPHLLRFSSSLDSSSSLSVLTPKREMLLLESDGPWETFLTPLIWVISCCFCCFFFSRVFDVGDGISTSFCLSEGQKTKLLWVFSPTQTRPWFICSTRVLLCNHWRWFTPIWGLTSDICCPTLICGFMKTRLLTHFYFLPQSSFLLVGHQTGFALNQPCRKASIILHPPLCFPHKHWNGRLQGRPVGMFVRGALIYQASAQLIAALSASPCGGLFNYQL